MSQKEFPNTSSQLSYFRWPWTNRAATTMSLRNLVIPQIHPIWLLLSTSPLVKGMRLWGSGHEELSEMFGLFCCSESLRGEEGSYPGLMNVTVCRLQASPQRWTCIVDSWCASACAKKPFTFIISVVPKCWSSDSSDSIMTFSTDCS